MGSLKDFADRETLVSVSNALAQPHFDYFCEVWDPLIRDGLARGLKGFRVDVQG